MKISINKDSSVPVRDQLVEQVSLQIASGMLTPKEKLPSIRALAARLGIHYSTVTAAYNHLADVGLLEIRQGSGVRVASIHNRENEPAARSNLDSMINDFLARASEAGFAATDVMQAFEKLKERKPVRRILAVDRNVDFHEVLLTELRPHFQIPVEACTVQEIMEVPDQMDDALILTSLYHLFTFQDRVKDRTRLVPCNIEPASLEMEKIATLRSGSLVLLVSVSETLMNMATKLIAAHRGEEIPVRAVLLNDSKELNYMVNHADLILCDSPSEETVRKIADPKILQVFKLYPPSTINLIQERLSKWG
jgi:DNA-binding transcriptional regulator YhcF (GntR family)